MPETPRASGVTLTELATSTGTQTFGNYLDSPIPMTPGNVGKFAVGRSVYGAHAITQTAQTGAQGQMTTQPQRTQYPSGGYSGPDRDTNRTGSGAQIMSPIQGIQKFFNPAQ